MIDGTLVEDGVGPTFLAGSESDRGDSQAAGRRYAVGRERPLVHLRGLTEGGLAGRSSRDDKWVVGLEYPRREVLLRFKRQPGVSGTRVVENLDLRVLGGAEGRHFLHRRLQRLARGQPAVQIDRAGVRNRVERSRFAFDLGHGDGSTPEKGIVGKPLV